MTPERRDGLVSTLLSAIDDALEDLNVTTEELGELWLAITEGATLRLVRLKPEMVRHVDDPR